MADVFCEIDCLAVRCWDCKGNKTEADKKERITVLMTESSPQRTEHFVIYLEGGFDR